MTILSVYNKRVFTRNVLFLKVHLYLRRNRRNQEVVPRTYGRNPYEKRGYNTINVLLKPKLHYK